MKGKKVISKIVIAIAWLMVTAGLMTLLIAANQKNQRQVCRDVVVTIKNSTDKIYVDHAEILNQLESVQGSLINKPVQDIKITSLEDKLKRHQWIKKAELYIDSRNVLHVLVTERQPIARVITRAGHSFYIDKEGKKMSLVDGITVRLPVITNFTSATRWSKKDSVVMNGLLELLHYLEKDSFWNAQVGQIDVLKDHTVEIIPVIGNHIIKLGAPENIENKLHNLFVFYKAVLTKTGFDKYSILDIRFKGQVVGVKGNPSSIDSIQLKKNIEELIRQTQAEASAAAVDMKKQPIDSVNTNPANKSNPNPEKAPENPDPNAVKTTLPSKPIVQKETRQPKAVMKKVSSEE